MIIFIKMALRHFRNLLNEYDYLDRTPCKQWGYKQDGKRNLYCYDCCLDNNCPYDKNKKG